MVSPNTSTDDVSSSSMEDDNAKTINNRSAPFRQNPNSTSSSESESESDSEHATPRVASPPPQKKYQSQPRNVAASPKPLTSTKRSRDEEQNQELEKNKKKFKEVKKPPPSKAPRLNSVKKPDSISKSAKKNDDEIGFMKGVLAYQESKGMPKTNMTPVYEYIRKGNFVEHEYSNNQMYDKLRRLKMKFGGLKDKINAGDYKFKTPHEEAFYKLGRKIWGNGEEKKEESTDEEDENNGAEEDEKKNKGQDVEMAKRENEEEEKEDEDEAIAREGNLVSSNGVQKQSKQLSSERNRKPSFDSDVVLNNGSVEKLVDAVRKENFAMMNEIRDQLTREKQEIKNEIMVMVREALRSSVSIGNSDSVQFSIEEMIKRISYTREWPTLEKAEAKRLEHKWKKQTLVELDTSSKHLQLLQEECQLRLEKLRSQV